MILVALGGNLPHPVHGSPDKTCEVAIAAMAKRGIAIIRRSSWFITSPIPVSDQPWYINGVVRVETDMAPPAFLEMLHGIEAGLGRVRTVQNGPRTIDLDLVAWDNKVSNDNPILPHPRLHERAFVLYPIREIVPDWHHPVTGQSLEQMIASLPDDQNVRQVRK